MAGYYCSFYRNFSNIVQSFTNLLSPISEYKWSTDFQTAFKSVKTLLSSNLILTAPDLTRPFMLEVDASAVAAGAVLLQ